MHRLCCMRQLVRQPLLTPLTIASCPVLLGRELPLDLQKKVGPLPDGFLHYFTSRWVALIAMCTWRGIECNSGNVLTPLLRPLQVPRPAAGVLLLCSEVVCA